MPIHQYLAAHKLELRAREKFDQLVSELVGNRISDAQAREQLLVNMAQSTIKEGFVQTSPQSIRFAVDELGLVLKEIKRIYGK